MNGCERHGCGRTFQIPRLGKAYQCGSLNAAGNRVFCSTLCLSICGDPACDDCYADASTGSVHPTTSDFPNG